jgi:hypothetical protein
VEQEDRGREPASRERCDPERAAERRRTTAQERERGPALARGAERCDATRPEAASAIEPSSSAVVQCPDAAAPTASAPVSSEIAPIRFRAATGGRLGSSLALDQRVTSFDATASARGSRCAAVAVAAA